MDSHNKFLKYLNLLIASVMALVVSMQIAQATSVGSVSKIELGAFGTPPNRARIAKQLADIVVVNEALETVPNGSLSVDFIDNSKLVLGSDAKLIIDDMIYDSAKNQGSAIIKLTTGAFFWISGKINNMEDIRIETPVAIIGIRGTEFSINIGPEGQTNVSVISGLVDLVSKKTNERIEIHPGFNADADREGDLSDLNSGIPNTGDKAINTQIVESAHNALNRVKTQIKKANYQ
jgi:hypothetical protein